MSLPIPSAPRVLPSPRTSRRSRRVGFIGAAAVTALAAAGIAYVGSRDDSETVVVKPPYDGASPWNTPIPADANVHPSSDAFIASIPSPLTSDPDQYTYPVYEVNSDFATGTVVVERYYSDVTGPGDNDITVTGRGAVVRLPIPPNAVAADGHDAQLVVWNRDTGDEWGFFRFARNDDGTFTADNGYHYNTNWSGVPPAGFGSRGPGIPYMAGLIRPDEVRAGRIDHAIAFAFEGSAPTFINPPATKSDGVGAPDGLPEGARLRLNPALTDADFDAMGLTHVGKLVARALQTYGMIVADVSGRPKVFAEGNATAHWGGSLVADTVSPIPLTQFQVIDWRPDATLTRDYVWSSNDGDPWPAGDWSTTSIGGDATFDASTAKGRMRTATIGAVAMATTTRTFSSVHLRGRLEPMEFAIGDRNGSPAVVLSSSDSVEPYACGLELRPRDGGWRLFEVDDGVRTETALVPYRYAGGGTSIWFDIELVDGTVRAKVWNGNDPEPPGYQQTSAARDWPGRVLSLVLQITNADPAGYDVRWADVRVATAD
jgi:hypothetical protein